MPTPQQVEEVWERLRAPAPARPLHRRVLAAARFQVHGGARRVLAAMGQHTPAVLPSDGARLRTTDHLTDEDLHELFTHRRVAILHVPGFCPPRVADRLAALATAEYANWRVGGGGDTDMYYAGGSIPFEMALRDKAAFVRYCQERETFIEGQREAAGGDWPVDRLRRVLDERWPQGAHLGNPGCPELPWYRPAIMRVMSPEGPRSAFPEGYVHVDDRAFMSAERSLFSANIYLQVPPEGGELAVWPLNLTRSSGTRDRARRERAQALLLNAFDDEAQRDLRRFLPEPLRVRPGKGDLLLLDAGRPHAVAPVVGGLRATNQLFIVHEARRPLAVYA